MVTRKGEATKARILEAAADLLVRGNDINLDDVMDLTRTSKGQLFYYFPGGKEDPASGGRRTPPGATGPGRHTGCACHLAGLGVVDRADLATAQAARASGCL